MDHGLQQAVEDHLAKNEEKGLNHLVSLNRDIFCADYISQYFA